MSLLNRKLRGNRPERELYMTDRLGSVRLHELAVASRLCLPICGMGPVIQLQGYY